MNQSTWNITSGNGTEFKPLPWNNASLISLSADSVKNKTFTFGDVINCVILPILFIIGIFGNISTAIVFSRKKQKNASTYFIIGLAFSDLMVLVLRMISNIYIICHIYLTEYIRYIRPNSFVWTILSFYPQRSGNFFILFIVLERFTAVCFPLQLRQVWTAKRACIIIVIIILITLSDASFAVDVLVNSLTERIPTHGIVSTQKQAKRYMRSQNEIVAIWSFVHRIVADMLPLPLVFVFNVAIIIGIRRSSLFMEKLDMKIQKRREKERKTTRMLLTISVLFVLLSSPFVVYVYLITNYVIVWTAVPAEVYESFKLLNVINSVINFVMYGISDKSLRGKYVQLWKCK